MIVTRVIREKARYAQRSARSSLGKLGSCLFAKPSDPIAKRAACRTHLPAWSVRLPPLLLRAAAVA